MRYQAYRLQNRAAFGPNGLLLKAIDSRQTMKGVRPGVRATINAAMDLAGDLQQLSVCGRFSHQLDPHWQAILRAGDGQMNGGPAKKRPDPVERRFSRTVQPVGSRTFGAGGDDDVNVPECVQQALLATLHDMQRL